MLKITDAGIMAAGRGTRMNSAVPKSLTPVSGIALIDYILADLCEFGVRNVVVITRHDDVALINHLRERAPWFARLETSVVSGEGTFAAVSQITSLLGARNQIVSTCDVIAPSDALAKLAGAHLSHDVNPVMTVLVSNLVEDEAPVWVELSEERTTVMNVGKRLNPTGTVFGNIRVLGPDALKFVDRWNQDGQSQDSEFMGYLARECPGRVFGVDGGTVRDVDRPVDVDSAEKVAAHTNAFRYLAEGRI